MGEQPGAGGCISVLWPPPREAEGLAHAPAEGQVWGDPKIPSHTIPFLPSVLLLSSSLPPLGGSRGCSSSQEGLRAPPQGRQMEVCGFMGVPRSLRL